jgi:hypothetical protein
MSVVPARNSGARASRVLISRQARGDRSLLLQPGLEPGLLVEIGLHHIAHDGRGEIACTAVLEQRHHHDFRRAAARSPRTRRCPSNHFTPPFPWPIGRRQLRRAGLAANLEARNQSALRAGAAFVHHAVHAVDHILARDPDRAATDRVSWRPPKSSPGADGARRRPWP